MSEAGGCLMMKCAPFGVVDGGDSLPCGQLNLTLPKKAYIHVTRFRQGQSSFCQAHIIARLLNYKHSYNLITHHHLHCYFL